MSIETKVYSGDVNTELAELKFVDTERENVILSFTSQFTSVLTLVCC